MRRQHCPPSPSSPLPLPSLRLCSTLPTCLQHRLPSLRSCSALPTFSQHCLPSLRSCSALPTCSRHCLPSSRFRITAIVFGGLLAYMMNAIAEIC
ncbi:hypothetical protein O181_120594 [Austropuccinia psidii MF-1]|uniref:Uncharacterized protein n=1 Tax=Austropuccinia psidii MF-1 TaxID=1389203 RepID=A0A9Q3Q0J2_9BASI|nr:hypothetical protein [Austropuccinia psidii MF-1]